MDDKELYESTLDDQVVEDVAVEPAPEPTIEAQPRDDLGKFAPKEPEPVAVEAKSEKDEAFVPSWRLREMREEREASERRFAESQSQWQRQIAELQARIPKQETPVPDMFENPNEFVNHGVRQAVDPIKSQMNELREFYSKKEAIREHGQEKVNAAYAAVAQGMQSRDPEVMATYQRAMQSMDPYGEIVGWHAQKTVYSQIGNDPNAWFEKQLEERMKDPSFQATILGRTQQSVRSNASAPNIIRPPSLNRIAASGHDDGPDDVSDAGLAKDAWG